MQLYAIRRRSGWANAEQLEQAAAVSRRIGDEEMSGDIRWIRSYVVNEADGNLGTVCIYQSSGPEAIRAHAQRVGMPADEITPIGATVVVREDPEESPADS